MLDAANSAQASRLMQLLEGRYAFLALLGRGGSGLVFEVENKQLGRKEALKLLGQILGRHDGERFVHEAKMMAALDHPRIIPIYAFGEDEGSFWYSMRLVEGPTLAGFIRMAPEPDLTLACQVAIPVLEALVLSHGRGIIHRDIKPANILLDPSSGPLLTDFGIAKAESDPTLTETGLVLGTPAYVSPEQSLGQKVDGRSDLYALAISLYQLLTGRLPFQEGNSLAIVLQRFQEEAIPLRQLRPDLPEGLIAIITQAMARKPEDRFAHAQDMLDAFLRLAEGAGIHWQQPILLPPGLGPKRDPLPEPMVSGQASNPTVAILTPRADAEANPLTRLLRAARSAKRAAWTGAQGGRVLRAMLGLSVLVLGSWFLLNRWRASTAPTNIKAPAISTPAKAAKPPERKVESIPEPRSLHPAQEPLVTRRAVTPPELLETPKVAFPEGSPCGGRSVTVELQVDETGAVSSARLLSSVPPGCADPILQAARGCKFKPALAVDGKPVAATLAIALEP